MRYHDFNLVHKFRDHRHEQGMLRNEKDKQFLMPKYLFFIFIVYFKQHDEEEDKKVMKMGKTLTS